MSVTGTLAPDHDLEEPLLANTLMIDLLANAKLLGVILAVALLVPTAPRTNASGTRADVVFQWNQALQEQIASATPLLTPRYYSMMHIAMFDAINAIEREFSPYRVRLRNGAGGSPAAAAAQAAQVGAQVAREVLAWRQNDHWTDPFLPYVEPLLIGRGAPAHLIAAVELHSAARRTPCRPPSPTGDAAADS
jgi:hypothetical protein